MGRAAEKTIAYIAVGSSHGFMDMDITSLITAPAVGQGWREGENMRLIDADTIPYIPSEGRGLDDWAYRYQIAYMTTIDPVHAAGGCRCRECLLCHACHGEPEHGKSIKYCAKLNRIIPGKGFCGFGKKKASDPATAMTTRAAEGG